RDFHVTGVQTCALPISDPGFGKVFTDHMVSIEWDEGRGWHSATLGPRVPISLDPAAAVLHYAQEIFEGLKAYRLADGGIALFRQIGRASCRARGVASGG